MITDVRLEIVLGLKAASTVCYESAVKAGWYQDPHTGEKITPNMGERLMLITSEIVEAFEGHRKDLMDKHLPHRRSIEVELADALIRIFNLAGAEGLDLGGALLEKLDYNRTREDHKLENRRKPGGLRC